MKLLIRMLVSTMMMVAIWVVVGPVGACGCSPVPENPNLASLRSDLRGLASAEELYRKDYGKYSASFTDLAFTPSSRRVLRSLFRTTGSMPSRRR